MQLVAYGAQDIYLTGNPQITFFKVVYRRHTNFSMECIRQTINGSSATSTSNTTGNVTISRNGDLVHRVYVTSSSTGITDGSEIVQEAELEIGGQRIDRHYKDWNDAWNELSTDESKALGLKSMQGCIGTSVASASAAAGQLNLVQVPLNFWFCRNPGLALPLIALQYHEVKVKIIFGTTANVGSSSATCEVWSDYIYLDTDERRRFAQVSHEYLIEQIQRQTETLTASTTHDFSLNFNHPVKELVWTYPTGATFDKVQLKLNGHDRFAEQNEPYFTLRQPYDYHSAVPRQNLPVSARISLLDRQTTFTAPTEIATLTAEGATGDVAASGSDMHLAAGVLIISGSGTSPDASQFPTGTQLALTIITAGDGADISGQSGGAPAVGDLYFATVTGGATGTTVLTMNISTPTSLTGKSFTGIEEAAGSADNCTINFLLVTNGNSSQARTSQMTNKIGVYSFALKPEEHQPSGTCNFSRIDNAQLHGDATGAGTITVYAVNYNVLRIMSGMGGLAYSN